jgi:hypothetical protein
MKRALLVFSFLICCFSLDSQIRLEAQSTNLWVTIYNDVWTRPPVNEIDFSALTHIITGVGNVEPTQSSPYYTTTADQPWDNTYETSLLNAAHAAGVKVILELGSVADAYSYICSDQSSGGRLDTYVNNVTSFAQSHGYDGVDVDWEFPYSSDGSAAKHGELMKRLKTKLNTWSPPGILTIAVGCTNASDYVTANLRSYVDQVNFMGYDLSGYWNAVSGFNTAVNRPSDCPNYDEEVVSDGVSVWSSAVGASKTGMGLSFMGYLWSGITSYCQNASGGGGRTYYSDIVAGTNYLSQGTYHWQDQAQVPYLSHTSPSWWLSYDNPQSLTAKINYAKQHNLGGIMIWQQGGYVASLPAGQRNPLLQAVKDAVGATLDPPSAPTLSSPSDGATGVSLTPSLSWNSSSGATSYQLQVSTVSSFSSTVVNQTGIAATSYTVNLNGNTSYYWRVNASNVAGTSSWSSARSFTTGAPPPPPSAPTLASPADGAAGVSAAPTLSWNASSGATSYQLQVSLNSSFSTAVVNQSGITTTSYAANGLTSSTTYYWRVAASNGGGTSGWSTSRSFTTAAVSANGLVAAYSFDEGSGTVLNDLSFSGHNGTVNGATWSTSGKYNGGLSFNGTSSYVATTLPISTLSSGFTVTAWVYCDPSVSDWAWVIGEDTGGFFFIGKSANGNDIHAGADGILNAQDFTSSTITTGSWQHWAWTWDGTTSANGIKIYINGNLTSQARATGTSTQATTNIRIGARNPSFGEYWKGMIDEIRIYNRALTQADVQNAMNTPVGQTTTSPPNAPTLSSPANGATGVAVSPTLNWNASTGATSYGLQLSTSQGFSTTVVNQTGIAATSYAVSGLTNNTTYYWRVNATNTAGTSGWSSSRSFTTVSSSINHSIVLPQGWSMISSYVQPSNVVLDSLLAKIKPHLEIVKNGGGQVYWPTYGINVIGNWDDRSGYQINMQSPDTLRITGSEITPESTPILLVEGVNLVAYLRNSPMRADSALASLGSSLLIAKNNAGDVYWPSYGINSIGSMKPGQGYQVQVSSTPTLTYPANAAPTPPSMLTRQSAGELTFDVPEPYHYATHVSNTGSNAILLVQAPELGEGDEIAVWTPEKMLVGSTVISQGRALVTVWGDNIATPTVRDGAIDREALSLTAWSLVDSKEVPLSITSVTDFLTGASVGNALLYNTNAVWVMAVKKIEEIPVSFNLYQNYPNPFNPSSIIKYVLPNTTWVRLEVFNLIGQKVAILVNEEQKAGNHEVIFQNPGLGSGVYFYKLTAGKLTDTRKMIIVR